ncbi:MAG: hypothetical protein LBL82_04785 [Oscillospiraceae bacterium]|jgi:hypothetical protein|nr:hypothetical protein [Oscillospiraceae bacterium]
MATRFFSKNMYREGLKRTRAVGLIYTITMLVFSLIVVWSTLSDAYGYRGLSVLRTVEADADAASYFEISFYVALPVLAFIAFAFLNKRSASDFYHSIPVRREALALSLTAAVLTWAIGGILVAAIPSSLVFWLNPNILFDGTEYFAFAALCVGTMIYLAGAILIAKSLTGTIFSNIVVLAMIILAPRAIIDVVFMLIDKYAVLTGGIEQIFPLADYRLNHLYYSLFPVNFITPFSEERPHDFEVSAYMAIVGIAYTAIGTLLFAKRKSELAGTASLNTKMHCVVRTLLAFFFTIPLCQVVMYVILSWVYWPSYSPPSGYGDSFLPALIYAMFAYYTYEIIVSRGFKTIKKASKQLVYLLAANVLLIAVSVGSVVVLNLSPSVQNIDSVEFDRVVFAVNHSTEQDEFFTLYEIKNDSILKNRMENVEFDSDALKSIVVNRMLQTVKNSDDPMYMTSSIDPIVNFKSELTIHLKWGGSIRRSVNFSLSDFLAMTDTIMDEFAGQQLLTLPKYKAIEQDSLTLILKNTPSVLWGNSVIDKSALYDMFGNSSTLNLLYEDYLKDFDALSDINKLIYLSSLVEGKSSNKASVYDYYNYSFDGKYYIRSNLPPEIATVPKLRIFYNSINGKRYCNDMPINTDTPRAYDVYTQITNADKQKVFNNFKKLLYNGQISSYSFFIDKDYFNYYNQGDNISEYDKAVFEEIDEHISKDLSEIDTTKPYHSLYLNYTTQNGNNFYYWFYVQSQHGIILEK